MSTDRRARAASETAAFLAVAPGVVTGLVSWLQGHEAARATLPCRKPP
jgi:hypothetical protein